MARRPFFMRFVEKQPESKTPPEVRTELQAGATLKYPSDRDEWDQTMKYPSDGDEGTKI